MCLFYCSFEKMKQVGDRIVQCLYYGQYIYASNISIEMSDVLFVLHFLHESLLPRVHVAYENR